MMVNQTEALLCSRIVSSGEFNPQWYLAQYPDVARSGMDPVLHFVRYGMKEGRKASPEPIQQTTYSDPKTFDAIIVYSINRKYIPYFCVSLYSLINHADRKKNYLICILHENVRKDEFSPIYEILPQNVTVRILNIDSMEIISAKLAKIKHDGIIRGSITYETYFRLLIPDILQEFKAAIYLDSDTIILDDISRIIDIGFDGNLLLAVKDVYEGGEKLLNINSTFPFYTKTYFNAGVLGMNLAALRNYSFVDRVIDKLQSGKKFLCQDQDLINIVCHEKIKRIPMRWNLFASVLDKRYKDISHDFYCDYASNFCKPSVIHYASNEKPWQYNDYFTPVWWRYARETPYFQELIDNCPFEVEQILA